VTESGDCQVADVYKFPTVDLTDGWLYLAHPGNPTDWPGYGDFMQMRFPQRERTSNTQ